MCQTEVASFKQRFDAIVQHGWDNRTMLEEVGLLLRELRMKKSFQELKSNKHLK